MAIILNSNSESIIETDIFQIVASCTDNGITVTSPTIIYTSSNTDVATVNSSGVVTGVSVGNATITITCTYQGVNAILTMSINAKPVEPVISYTAPWSNTTTIKYASSTTCTMTKSVDGVLNSDLSVSYAFDTLGSSLISSGVITITKKSNTSYQIKNVSNSILELLM